MDIISCYSRFVNFRKLTMMEEVLLRFPHIGEKIFEELNYQSLIDCQKVSSSWKSFLLSRFRPAIRVTKISTKCSEETLTNKDKVLYSKQEEEDNETDDSLKGSDDSEDQTSEDERVNDTDDSGKGSDDSKDQTTEGEKVGDTDDSSKGSDDSEDQTTEDEDANDSDDSLNGSNDSEEQTSEDAGDWHESNGGWFGGYDDSKEDEEVNDPDDSLKGSDDSKEQTSEYENPAPQPLEAKNTRIEPSVTAEEVTDSEFDKFMTALFEVFEANEKEQLPIEDVKRAIFEQTSITEGQLMTCIRKLIDLNEARYIGNVLYLI